MRPESILTVDISQLLTEHRTAELRATVKGPPVETGVAWRLVLPAVLRDSTELSGMERTAPVVVGDVQ